MAEWWTTADSLAERPDRSAVDALRARASSASLDEAEQREEMIEGLDQLLLLHSATALPILQTQHRVIGTDACHFAAPATLVVETSTPGKLFLTSQRLMFAAGRAQTWPWHRLRDVIRRGRDLFLTVAGADSIVRIQCNSYGDAMTARYIAMKMIKRYLQSGQQ